MFGYPFARQSQSPFFYPSSYRSASPFYYPQSPYGYASHRDSDTLRREMELQNLLDLQSQRYEEESRRRLEVERAIERERESKRRQQAATALKERRAQEELEEARRRPREEQVWRMFGSQSNRLNNFSGAELYDELDGKRTGNKPVEVPIQGPKEEQELEEVKVEEQTDEEAEEALEPSLSDHDEALDLEISKSLDTLSKLRFRFESLNKSFRLPDPSAITFASPSRKEILFQGETNKALLAFEDSLVNLLPQLDSIQSYGDPGVRAERKNLVNRVNEQIETLDEVKKTAWKRWIGQKDDLALSAELESCSAGHPQQALLEKAAAEGSDPTHSPKHADKDIQLEAGEPIKADAPEILLGGAPKDTMKESNADMQRHTCEEGNLDERNAVEKIGTSPGFVELNKDNDGNAVEVGAAGSISPIAAREEFVVV